MTASSPSIGSSNPDCTGPERWDTKHAKKDREMHYKIEETYAALGFDAEDWPAILRGHDSAFPELFDGSLEADELYLDALKTDIMFRSSFCENSGLAARIQELPLVLMLGLENMAGRIRGCDEDTFDPERIAEIIAQLGESVPPCARPCQAETKAARSRLVDKYGDLDDIRPWIAEIGYGPTDAWL